MIWSCFAALLELALGSLCLLTLCGLPVLALYWCGCRCLRNARPLRCYWCCCCRVCLWPCRPRSLQRLDQLVSKCRAGTWTSFSVHPHTVSAEAHAAVQALLEDAFARSDSRCYGEWMVFSFRAFTL